jgi:hypothetical protein
MNKVQSFARVIVGAVAIYFSINVLVIAVTPVGLMLNQPSLGSAELVVIGSVLSVACIVLLQYFGVFRPQKVVSLITRPIAKGAPMDRGQWLPAAYRLVCVFAGLYCLYGVLYRMISLLAAHTYYRASEGQTLRLLQPEETITLLLLLVLGVYLLAGAPHFVRWHLKRTIRFCRENAIE